jgi:trimeric autotransporter adhesin
MKKQSKENAIKPMNILIAIALLCAAVAPNTFGVVPPPDGGYPGFNTAAGQNALKNLTTGSGNTGAGWYSLFSATTASFNTGLGAGALALNTADENTAIGAATLLFNTASGNTAIGSRALLNNTTGGTLENIAMIWDVGPNVAVGWQALESNTVAGANTAIGYQALQSFTTGPVGYEQLGLCTAVGFQALASTTNGWSNSGFGYQALLNNTEGNWNTAIGSQALVSNTTGNLNTAIGINALLQNNTGAQNTAVGANALGNSNASGNTAIGHNALGLTTGFANTALGAGAGRDQTSGSGNVYIGVDVSGNAGENYTTYIKNVYDSQTSARAVYVNADNKIGTLSSSRRYKEDINPMDKASEGIFALNPVTYRYKTEIDRSQALSFGLIAEEVAEISPDLITRDEEGKPQTVRYEAVNAMLLNEFLKEHKKVQALEATIAQLRNEMETVVAQLKEQDSKIQKVSAQIELNRPVAPLASISQ